MLSTLGRRDGALFLDKQGESFDSTLLKKTSRMTLDYSLHYILRSPLEMLLLSGFVVT